MPSPLTIFVLIFLFLSLLSFVASIMGFRFGNLHPSEETRGSGGAGFHYGTLGP